MWSLPWGRGQQKGNPEPDLEQQIIDDENEGITILHDDGLDAVVDICFVHGLGGHRIKTWTESDSRPVKNCCWPRDLLPQTLANQNSRIRVLSFGYDANLVRWRGGSSNGRVYGYARSLMQELVEHREHLGGENCERPIVFVGHSLGGLVIKSTICQAHQRNPEKPERNIFDQTVGFVFIGTPHHGSDLTAWAKYLERTLEIAQRSPNNNLLDVLSPDAVQLKDLSENFDTVATRSKPIEKYCCYETWSTTVGGIDVGQIVSEMSSRMNDAECVAIKANHVGMCKFNNAEDPNYRAVARCIKKLVSQVVKSRKRRSTDEAAEFQRLRDELLSTLDAPELFERGCNMPEAQSGTFQWLMDPDQGQRCELVDFLRSDATLFWISGKAGSGKSTLMKFLFEHPALRTYLDIWSNGEAYATASFFFYKRGQNLQKSLEGLLRSLLYQLLQQVPEVFAILQRWERVPGTWTAGKLRRAFTECMNEIPSKVRIFLCIDGLDEYVTAENANQSTETGNSQQNDQLEIADFICSFAQKTSRLKLCVSSRPYEEFRDRFDFAQTLRLQDLTEQDIIAYIDHGFDTINERRWESTLATEEDFKLCRRSFGRDLSPREVLRELIAERSSGVFLWVQLIVRRIRDQIFDKIKLMELVESVEETDGKMENLFDQMWSGIKEECREEGLLYIYMLQTDLPCRNKLDYMAFGLYAWLILRIDGCYNNNDGTSHEFSKATVQNWKIKTVARLRKCCGHFIDINGEQVDVAHHSIVDYFSSIRFSQRNAVDLDKIKRLANRYAVESILLQLQNPRYLASRSHDLSKRQDWVFETLRAGARFIGGSMRGSFASQLIWVAGKRRLTAWAFGISCATYAQAYHQIPRGQLFRDFAILCLESCDIFENYNMDLSGYNYRWHSLIEIVFELLVVVRTGYADIEEVWSKANLRKDWNQKHRGHSAWENCLVLLMFFYLVHMRPLQSKQTQRQLEPPRCTKTILNILHDFVVQLIEHGADPRATIEMHPMLSRDWEGAQPIWALYCYQQQPTRGMKRILQDGKRFSALEVIERVFGSESKAWKLIGEKAVQLDPSSQIRKREMTPEGEDDEDLSLPLRKRWRSGQSTPSTAFNSTNVAVDDGCTERRNHLLAVLLEERNWFVNEWADSMYGAFTSVPLAFRDSAKSSVGCGSSTGQESVQSFYTAASSLAS
ncbi:uncharacterized protein BKA78DRAFT_300874 [Phyllosticta capitalensis]|uniref:uncharacterized protein n=1 Tax=Phyllosticta capitalensis TaxID=121624 RepID=UPI0031321F8C